MTRRYVAYAPEAFASTAAKTAHGVIAYGTDPVVAVVDPSCSGKRVREVVPRLACDAPIVETLAQAFAYKPTALLLGTAPMGGALPREWRADILCAIEAGLEIVSGLHTLLAHDPEFVAAARERGTRLWDVRAVGDIPLFSGSAYGIAAPILLTVGNDCAVGKMTVALELTHAAIENGTKSVFVPTGQTGIVIAGWGIAVDRTICDFTAGACEQLVLEGARRDGDILIVEGQGAINHPAYAPVTLGLLYGCAPDALLLVYDLSSDRIERFGTPRLDIHEAIDTYEALCASVKPANVIGVALNTRGLSDTQAHAAIADARRQTRLPADDVVRFGAQTLYAAIAPHLFKRTARSHLEPR